ncbi:MAG: hypothetical protein AVDCRST_MAG76-1415 [uncultured Acidimicrobiales bacterium]|uniref:FecR protein domain-containing protein n=1 Tax=uncultured Acidimicrobiales bacterium TaxID=310071 RepID=A0A6J4HUJ0_9ACTN|nr:MAG: hypothetical protein AVDCRST_MAG76-1415 [uncultured Acidimicrobiales bacterium]
MSVSRSSWPPRIAALVATCGLTIAMIGCNRSAKATGEGRLDPGGRVLLTQSGGKPETVARSRPLKGGDAIEVVEGTAKVTLPAGDVIELQPRSVMSFSRGPELRSGDVLVTSSGSSGTVRAAGSEVGVKGASRVTLAPSLRIVTYQGTASVSSAGRALEVPALRSAEVSLVGLLPGRPSPLVIDRADPWLGRFLAEAADKEEALESRAIGFTTQARPGEAASPAFYGGLLPGLPFPVEFNQAEVDRLGRAQPQAPVRAGEVLVGSAIAVQGKRGTFAERLAGAAAFRAEGAPWSLVALDQQVLSLDALVRLVDGAVNVAPLELAVAPPQVGPAAVPSEPPPDRASTARRAITPSTRATPTTRAPARRPTSPPQPTAPPPPTQPAPLLPLLDNAVDPVVDLLADLLGGNR